MPHNLGYNKRKLWFCTCLYPYAIRMAIFSEANNKVLTIKNGDFMGVDGMYMGFFSIFWLMADLEKYGDLKIVTSRRLTPLK